MSQHQRIFFWSITAALGGFLFGFDTAVISGVEQSLQSLWNLNAWEHGLTVSIALIGTVLGSMLGGIPAEKLGRKITLFWIAVLYLVASVGSALATNWELFLVFRFLGGLGVGASSVAAPMYITEISPAKSRGRLVGLFQFNVVLGILIAYLSNYLLQGVSADSWRWMLGVQAFPSLLFLIAVLNIPESPRWLLLVKGQVAEASTVLNMIDPDTAEETLLALQQHARGQQKAARLFSSQYSTPVMLAVLFAVFNQVSGINAIIYYAPRIFEMTGLGKSSALLSSAGIGLVNLIFTMISMNLIDRFGRRTLMKIGSVGLIVTLALVARAFYVEDFSGLTVPLLLFGYIAFFGFSQGAVIWVFISEIFPNEVRSSGQALGSFTHWLMAAIITFTFPYLAEHIGGGNTFLFFTIMMVLQLLFVIRLMPETKGTSLEGIEKIVVLH
ncbi:sugar porter family MFS transporter [Spirosoma utsteinense]|uniref:Sugar porter (SP) family MFS transporter n=1 Tax=Spirosoma utsteinense TaxID=2585773 RepID=A0ABR6WDZ9_9BACT|nr:sugar porter family MFS transporter [Spirosoma utsteinense]MBC3788804.1 sugar porter (SP) family MFS transporter [Spirosoma utsteinense]MBC3794398.1 sugar porter (SP) family MFS transporter [Spirosoma utsteinense]